MTIQLEAAANIRAMSGWRRPERSSSDTLGPRREGALKHTMGPLARRCLVANLSVDLFAQRRIRGMECGSDVLAVSPIKLRRPRRTVALGFLLFVVVVGLFTFTSASGLKETKGTALLEPARCVGPFAIEPRVGLLSASVGNLQGRDRALPWTRLSR